MSDAVAFSMDPTIQDRIGGVLGINGVLRFDGTVVELEYQTTNNSLAKSEAATVRLDLQDLTAIELRRWPFAWRVVLRASGLTVFQGVPGAHHERVHLKIARSQRDQASKTAWRLQSALENTKLPGAGV